MKLILAHVTTYRFDRFVHPGAMTVRLRPRQDRHKFTLSVLPGPCEVHWERDLIDNWSGTFAIRRAVNFLSLYSALEVDIGASPEPPQLPRDGTALMEEFGRIRHVTSLSDHVQTPHETLEKGTGTCRDVAWLLASALRDRGYESRFVSGYLVQVSRHALTAELHAWAAIPVGEGLVGLDPFGGPVGDRHIPLAATPHYLDADPISGCVDEADVQVQFSSQINVTRVGG